MHQLVTLSMSIVIAIVVIATVFVTATTTAAASTALAKATVALVIIAVRSAIAAAKGERRQYPHQGQQKASLHSSLQKLALCDRVSHYIEMLDGRSVAAKVRRFPQDRTREMPRPY